MEPKAITAKISDMCKAASAQEKKPFEEQAAADKASAQEGSAAPATAPAGPSKPAAAAESAAAAVPTAAAAPSPLACGWANQRIVAAKAHRAAGDRIKQQRELGPADCIFWKRV